MSKVDLDMPHLDWTWQVHNLCSTVLDLTGLSRKHVKNRSTDMHLEKLGCVGPDGTT